MRRRVDLQRDIDLQGRTLEAPVRASETGKILSSATTMPRAAEAAKQRFLMGNRPVPRRA